MINYYLEHFLDAMSMLSNVGFRNVDALGDEESADNASVLGLAIALFVI